MAQLDNPRTSNKFIIVFLQSNEYINEELNNRTKVEVAKAIIDTTDVISLASYIHGQIIVEISNTNVLNRTEAITKKLENSFSSMYPPIFISVSLSSYTTYPDDIDMQHIYIWGSDELNDNFIKSISDFYPKK